MLKSGGSIFKQLEKTEGLEGNTGRYTRTIGLQFQNSNWLHPLKLTTHSA